MKTPDIIPYEYVTRSLSFDPKKSSFTTFLESMLDPLVVEGLVLLLLALDPRDAVLDRGVAAPAEALADVGERGIGQLAREPDGDMARLHELLVAL